MIKRNTIFTICFLVLALFLNPVCACGTDLKIGLIGDQSGSYDIQQSYQILDQGITILKTNNVEMMVHLGDLVESSKPVDEISSMFSQATSILNKVKIPWFLTAGDHDVNPLIYQQNSSDRSREQLFQSLYLKLNPCVNNHLYYSFDFKGYHFIVLYALEYLHTDSKWGNVFLSRISDIQYNWLKTDLNSNKQKNTIVFIHKPLWYNWSSWLKIHQLLRQYNVKAVVAGHSHYNQDDGVLDGINYFTIGATGGMIKSSSPNAGGVHHVTIMDLNDGKVSFKIIPLDQKVKKLSFTSRYIMDRIQAIDIVLGNLWSFARYNPVYIKDGKLTNSPSSGEPALLQLKGLGNPAEFPVKITIEFSCDDPKVILTNAKFAEDAGEIAADNMYECILRPSYGIYVANTSSVDADTLKPLWIGTLGVNGTAPLPGTKINLKITMSFVNADGEEFSISSQVATLIQTVI